MNSPSLKHIPQRTCVACRQTKDKKELIRLVRVAGRGVEVDAGGKKAGRGAYLCRAQECWDIGFEGSRLEHTLRANLSQENREQLIKFGKEVLAEGRVE